MPYFQEHDTVNTLHKVLDFKKMSVAYTHNSLLYSDRETTFNDFFAGKYTMLITTDLLGRSVNIPGLFVVINYDMPCYPHQNIDITRYMLRIGRAARFGNYFIVHLYIFNQIIFDE